MEAVGSERALQMWTPGARGGGGKPVSGTRVDGMSPRVNSDWTVVTGCFVVEVLMTRVSQPRVLNGNVHV